jgi:hypothetical protein
MLMKINKSFYSKTTFMTDMMLKKLKNKRKKLKFTLINGFTSMKSNLTNLLDGLIKLLVELLCFTSALQLLLPNIFQSNIT